MSPFTELLAPTKSEKHGAFTWDPVAGVLTLTGTRNHCRYRVAEFAADVPGRAFVLAKLDAGTDRTEGRYACLVGPHGCKRCECKGFASAGRCKHLAALADLIRAGRL